MSLCSQEAPSVTDLVHAIWMGELSQVERIVHANPDLVNATTTDAARFTPLHRAIEANNLPIVSFLLERGADVNAVNICRSSSLHVAAENNVCKDIVQLLLVRGANVSARNQFSATALHSAMRYGNIELAEALLDHGVDCEERDGMLWTPLHYAAYGDAVSAVVFLVCRGVLIDEVDSTGWTPLLLALEEIRLRAATWLLKFGVPLELDEEIRALNQRGNTWNRLRKVIQDRRQEVETVLLDNELPFFSALAPVVIRIIIDCMVTPELVTLEEVSSGSG